MKKIQAFLLILPSLLCLSLQNPNQLTIYTTKGLYLKKFQIYDDNFRTTIYAAIIDPNFFRSDIKGFDKKYSDGVSAIDVGKRGAKVVLGSGFVKSFSPMIPNGFLKINNSVINPYSKNGFNGIAGVREGKLLLLKSSTSTSQQVYAGFQTGPFLVSDRNVVYNNNSKKADERYNRSFIAFNNNGKIIAAITDGPVSLKELSDFLTKTIHQDLRCSTALNLSGGGSETLVVQDLANQKSFRYGGYSDTQSALIAFY